MAFKGLKPITYGGREVWPLIEGGKGVSATNHRSSGAWAAAGGIGTVSAVNADSYDAEGKIIPQLYDQLTRLERHEQLIRYAIDGAVAQVKRAYDIASGNGAININVLWEMGGAQRVLEGVLEKTRGLVTGVTCGAGMPYRLAEIAQRFNVNYLPIISSARAFRALWKRSYNRVADLMAAVVYEDPWLAGGHNGLSNAEDPEKPEDPYPRVHALRETMRAQGISDNVPIIMAGGVWYLREWDHWIDNLDLGQIAFQFGTRPLLTQESPISDGWKRRLLNLEEGDVYLNRFSPTGFYSSAVSNPFLRDLQGRSERQVAYSSAAVGEHEWAFPVGARARVVYLTAADKLRAEEWVRNGFTEALRTPDSTLVFVTPEKAREIHEDQIACMGCLSACLFSNWAQNEAGTTGKKADPRSYCIQKTLQAISHSGDTENQLMFAGHNAYKFKSDPFYANGFIPSVRQLVERIMTGD
jgi:NAD(P)H-dependent flavin oxidoreductase YrpB (nitropropane dioxygenase family)